MAMRDCNRWVEGRLQRLRDAAETKPVATAEAAWAWIAELAKRSKRDAASADAECNELFSSRRTAYDPDGPTDGLLDDDDQSCT